jgi:predicted metalloprotease with PDZ domain
MYSEFALKRGFTSRDVERVTNSVCGCDLHQFFEAHIRSARPIDFNKYLASVGLRAEIDTIPAIDSAGKPLGDTRVWAYPPKRGGRMRIHIGDPRGVWATSGLHTGMEIIAFNAAKIDSFPDFRRALRPVKYGDVVPVDVIRDGRVSRVTVRVGGYDRVTVRIVDIPTATPTQVERRKRWLAAAK